MNLTTSPFGGDTVAVNIEAELSSESAQIDALVDKLVALNAECAVYLVGDFPRQRRAIKLFIPARPQTSVG